MPRVLNPFSNVPSRREFIRLLALTGAAGASGSSLFGSRASAAGPTLRRNPVELERHHLGPRQRDVGRPLPARDHGPGRRVLSTTTTTAGSTSSWSTAAPATSTSRRRRSRTRSTRTTATARSPTSPTRPASPAARSSAWAAPSPTTTTTATRTSSSPPTAAARCTTTTATARSPTSPTRPGVATPGLDDERGVVRLRQRRPARSVPVQLRPVLARQQRVLRRQQAGQALLLHPARLQADAQPAVSQQRRRHVHRGQRRNRHPARARARRSASSRPTSTATG